MLHPLGTTMIRYDELFKLLCELPTWVIAVALVCCVIGTIIGSSIKGLIFVIILTVILALNVAGRWM